MRETPVTLWMLDEGDAAPVAVVFHQMVQAIAGDVENVSRAMTLMADMQATPDKAFVLADGQRVWATVFERGGGY